MPLKYYANFEISADVDSLQGAIQNMETNNLAPSMHPEIDNMIGINRSTFYLGSRGSFTEMHIEDGNAASINVVHFNLHADQTQPSKLWLVVPDKLQMYEALQTVYAHRRSTPSCTSFLDHKNYYVSIEFLKANSITYFFILQYPGEAIYLKCGLLHQVVNLNPNLAEAVNFGDAEWNIITATSTFCGCKKRAITSLRQNPNAAMCVKQRKIVTYSCSVDKCCYRDSNVKIVLQHEQIVHGVRHTTGLYEERQELVSKLPSKKVGAANPERSRRQGGKCDVCFGRYYSNLPQHLSSTTHQGRLTGIQNVLLEPGHKRCRVCNTDVKRMDRHIKTPTHKRK